MRLDKYLADANLGTRSMLKDIIKKKHVSVDGVVITDPGFKLSEGQCVFYKGEPVTNQKACYYLFYKPAGCVSATKDRQKTVLDYFPKDAAKELFPVGRLDKDTEGLLLVTNDGAFSHRLTSPKKHVSKLYYFEGEGTFCKDTVSMIETGMDIGDDKATKPAKILYFSDRKADAAGNMDLAFLSHLNKEIALRYNEKNPCTGESDFSAGLIEITEGRFHQVKRMLLKCGVRITYLKRLAIGQLFLDDTLKPGSYRPLTEADFKLLE